MEDMENLSTEQFKTLDDRDALNYLYEIVSEIRDRMELVSGSVISGGGDLEGFNQVFTRQGVQPVRRAKPLPEGFERFFGSEPPYAQRGQWEKDLAAFGGLVDLTQDPSYLVQAALSYDRDLGAPMAYLYDGVVRLAFENRPKLWVQADQVWGKSMAYKAFVSRAANTSIR